MKTVLPLAALLAACAGSAPPSSGSTTGSPPAAAEVAASSGASAGGETTPQTAASAGGQLDGYDGVFAADPLLTAEQVAGWPADALQLRRNEIYARYGRSFKTESIRAHFQAKPWYREVESYSDAVLTEHDRKNAALIKSFEGSGPERSGQVGKLFFMDASTVIISDMPGSMYGFAGEERHFAARGGDRIVTWTGPAAFDMTDPGLADAELWTWNGKDWERQPIPRPNG